MQPFLVAVVLVWAVGSIAAFFYSQQQHIPQWLLFALLPALLLEISLYLLPGFEGMRKWFDRLGSKPLRAGVLVASGVTPYLMESLRTGTFGFTPFLLLLTLVSVTAFWYAVFKPGPAVDVLFLAFMAAVYLSLAFKQIYVRPMPHLQLEVMGRLMWVRVGLLAVLSLRRLDNVRFGFIPTSAEWRIGIAQFLYFLPVGGGAAYLLRFAKFHPVSLVWWKFALFVPALFFGVLWVLAVGEEFFFRGFLQQLVARGLGSEKGGLVVASAVFGMAHLPYRAFPNWRFAIVAGIAGLFYGISFLRSGSVRSSMVTHALVVTTWRTLFSG